ncbi:hypothetical protein PCASD_09959 [Puccinia coronata f. sp. avenae]|uniref:Uncharacterized protein n=1 Tax=Puccinia coronata f. sp. avenae TaxID=200324 RepID=A0A2N5UV47_9BASI|nr:hypothetical protein PCASD_09959 [Puccinia coronata f. sp. avenae]
MSDLPPDPPETRNSPPPNPPLGGKVTHEKGGLRGPDLCQVSAKPDWTLRSAEVPSFMGSAAFRQRRGATSGLAWDLRGTPVGALLGSPS